MDDDVTNFLKNCVPCALKPWEKIQVDIFRELQEALALQQYLIVVTDLYSKRLEVIATSDVTTATVIN
ncbi:unnamed protein product [Coregonus sp. 'balchen']|nr:unnamed protein product [Coregonus sp. 'balchen']